MGKGVVKIKVTNEERKVVYCEVQVFDGVARIGNEKPSSNDTYYYSLQEAFDDINNVGKNNIYIY